MEHVITSKANPRFKELLALLRPSGAARTHTLLLGEKVIESWRSAPHARRLVPETLLLMEGSQAPDWALELAVPVQWLGGKLMAELGDAASPPPCALLLRLGPEPGGPLKNRVIVPWGIQDPGNLGAIFRSAAAFGFQEALLGPGCADPFNPKALRGSMGAAFLLAIRRIQTLDLGTGNWFALDGGPNSLPLEDAELVEPLRILVGNEGHGWKHEVLPASVQRIAIPTLGVESLNAAVAAGIACHEVQRRMGG
ncbi:MAG: RNA methyltransferase [Acidobacteriota bacterium]|nr:RNA methyltransferase [Acidobacteriota bacterium]